MKLEITHVTRYSYGTPVIDNINEIRLSPRTNYRQSCYQHVITVDPVAAIFSYEDFFGNRVNSFSVNRPHKQLTIKSHSLVVTQEKQPRSSSTLLLADELNLLQSDAFQNRYVEYLLETKPYTHITANLVAYADSSLDWDAAGSVYNAVRQLSRRIFTDFTYQPGATNVHTTADELLNLRCGVCQDFAHLMIAVCRCKGIPARYVSGYHFVGDLNKDCANFQQASHAWVEVHIPGVGWLGFDPTNNGTMTWRYVKLAHGRDYNDIVPIKGIYSGTPERTMEVTVDVRVVENTELD